MKIAEAKLTQKDLVLQCQAVKDDLYYSIDEENKRINVDSAKKRAVSQHMDYDQFCQMVLGANIFPIKSKEFQSLIDYNNNKTGSILGLGSKILNSNLTTFNNVDTLPNTQKINNNNTDNLDQTLQQLEKQFALQNFREFKKIIDKFYQKELNQEIAYNIFIYIQYQTDENLKKIFSFDFDVSYFLKLINVLEWMLQNEFFQNKKLDETQFLLQFLQKIISIKDFKSIIPKFLNSKEKEILKCFFEIITKGLQTYFVDEKEVYENTCNLEKLYFA